MKKIYMVSVIAGELLHDAYGSEFYHTIGIIKKYWDDRDFECMEFSFGTEIDGIISVSYLVKPIWGDDEGCDWRVHESFIHIVRNVNSTNND